MHQWHTHSDAAATASACACYLGDQIAAVLDRKPICHVALPGGNTPVRCLTLLAAQELPWDRVHWYLGDERCLPPGDPARNDNMIALALSRAIEITPDNFHIIPAELGPEAGAQAYTPVIEALDRLDIVLLGLGEDGHTASLFPGNPALQDPRLVVPVYDSPKPPLERVSLGITVLQSAGLRVVLATGAGKCVAIRGIKNGDDLPITRIGSLVWFVDQAAVCQ